MDSFNRYCPPEIIVDKTKVFRISEFLYIRFEIRICLNNLDKIQKDFLFYNSDDGSVKVQVLVDSESETIWATQKAMAELFGVTVPNISYHLKNIFHSGELSTETGIKDILRPAQNGVRGLSEGKIKYYNLDVIISVGYRVNSILATNFRIWATKVLKEFMVKGFVLDDERLKKGGNIFGKEYFDELLERVQEIRTSERLFYQKLTDIFAESVDYDRNSQICHDFYASVQNKLEYAVIGKTAAEIITSRADAKHPTMGLLTWKGYQKGGKIQLSDTKIAKNYMTHEELSELTSLVNLCLDSASLTVKRGRPIYMNEWVEQVNAQLKIHGYEILSGKGTMSREQAEKIVSKVYEEYRPVQDARYKSDFDQLVEKTVKK